MSSRTHTPARPYAARSLLSQTPASSAAAVADQLPAYRKPSHPLTIRAQDQIKALNGRPIEQIKDHSKKAEKRITDVAGLINDKLHEHEQGIAKRQKRWEKGLDTESGATDEAWSAQFRDKVKDATDQLEEVMRGIIDTGVAADRMADSLKWLHEHAPNRLEQEYTNHRIQRDSLSQLQHRRDTQGSTAFSEGSTPGPTPLDGSRPVLSGVGELLQDRLTRKKDEYTSLSLYSRYAHKSAYAEFKAMVHDAKYGDQVPLPRPDTWFTETGSPAPGVTQRNGDDDDGEDDIRIDRTSISTRCPITFQKFKEPYTSLKCPHTFEKSAILDMIRKSHVRVGGGTGNRPQGAIECPVTGCSQLLTANDLHHDVVLVRKLARMQRAEQQAAEDSGDENESDNPSRNNNNNNGDDDNEIELSQVQTQPQRRRPAAKVKAEPPSSRPFPPPSSSAHVEDLGSPSEDEDEEDEDEELV